MGAPKPKALDKMPISVMPPGAIDKKAVITATSAPLEINHAATMHTAKIPKVTTATEAKVRGARVKNARLMCWPKPQPMTICAAINPKSGQRPVMSWLAQMAAISKAPKTHGLGIFNF